MKEKLRSFSLNLFFLPLTALLFLTTVISVYPSDRKITKDHEKKIHRIAELLTEEISNRKIRSVVIKFVDLNGRTGPFERSLEDRFRKALIKVRKGRFKIFTKDAEVIIRGTVIPYAEKERFDLKIEVLRSGSQLKNESEILYTYTGIFK